MTTLNIVQGDTAPQVKVTLTRSDTGDAVNLTTASSVTMHFRQKNTTTVLFSNTNSSSSTDQANGIAIFLFTSGQLNISAGEYEAEIEIVFTSGTRETVFETINFELREDFQ
tara:strand:+ start:264 stop:599 length:336 start_codon:yes stop_codon:yes gene_type:complete